MEITIDILVKELIENFTYISKIDAVFFLKKIYNQSIQECIKAWQIAYE